MRDYQSAEYREKLRNIALKRFLGQVQSRSSNDEPKEKRCSGPCGETKPVAEFYTRREKLKSGLIAIRPHCRCISCERTIQRDHRARLKDRLEKEGLSLADVERPRKIRHKERNLEKIRVYQREWATTKRREEGKAVVGSRLGDTPDPILPARPLLDFLQGIEIRPGTFPRGDSLARRLYAIQSGEQDGLSLRLVDAVLHRLGYPEKLSELYPEEDNLPLVGYHYLDPDGVLDRMSE